jgi:predicted dehydrogenase
VRFTVGRPKVAVVGAGWWATQFLIPGLLGFEGADLVAVVDPDGKRLAAACKEFGLDRGFGSLHELLSDVPVDGIVVATPNASHYAVAREALSFGAHVMVEKPMTLRACDAWELVRLADEHDLHLQLGYSLQFAESAQRLRSVLMSRGIGEIRQITGVYSSMAESFYRGRPEEYDHVYHFPVTPPAPSSYSDPKIAGGGHGQIQLTHITGMALWATGLRAVEVSAFMENSDLLVDLFDAIAFRLDNSGVGVVGGSGNLRPGERRQQCLYYFGSTGYAVQDLVDSTIEIHYENGSVERSDAGTTGADHRFATVRGFADLIAGRGPNLAPGEAGAMSVELLEAAYMSAANGHHIQIAGLLEGAVLGDEHTEVGQ